MVAGSPAARLPEGDLSRSQPVLALTQGDPAGIGPEILLKLLQSHDPGRFCPLLIAERAALDAIRHSVSGSLPELRYVTRLDRRDISSKGVGR